MKATKGVHRGAEGGDAAVEDLNTKSLNAAKSGTSFAPATTPTPAPAKAGKSGKTAMHHHHHHASKKADAAAPEGTTAPADTSK